MCIESLYVNKKNKKAISAKHIIIDIITFFQMRKRLKELPQKC